jgi:hypothetical protein
MLDNIMLYWLPGTGASAARLYWESFRKPLPGPVTVPVGCTSGVTTSPRSSSPGRS